MEKSETISKLASALSAFQADMENVTKDGTNPFFKSAYATLENVISTAKPHLTKHGLAFVQFPSSEGLTTVLMHTSGEYIAADAKIVVKDATPQGQGSAITYMRRYALSAALGIATEDDDDGNEASAPRQSRQNGPQRTKAAPAPAKDPAIELAAAKERVMALLKLHKVPCKTKKECEDAVFDLTGLSLEPGNYDQIAETLAAKLDAKETQE